MLPCPLCPPWPNQAAVGGRTVWAGGSGEVRFPQRSYVGALLNMLAVLSSSCSAYGAALSERCGHEKQKPEV